MKSVDELRKELCDFECRLADLRLAQGEAQLAGIKVGVEIHKMNQQKIMIQRELQVSEKAEAGKVASNPK